MGVEYGKAAEIARNQNGRIATWQLRDCGFGNSSIENGIHARHLHRVRHGVYALGHRAPNRLSDWNAAVLACGPQAWLSHLSAARLMKIRDREGLRIDVTVASGRHGSPSGISLHRSRLEPWETTTWASIPVTSPSRTMVDTAHAIKDPEHIEWAMRELQLLGLYDRQLLELSNHRRPNRTLTRLLDGFAATQSPLEIAFLHRVVRRHHLPEPECQAKLERFRVDFFWPEARLVVEVDGKNHDLPMMQLADAARDEVLTAAGNVVLRFRWADIHRHDAVTAAHIAAFHPGTG
jgi:very-short-patch-repair endonuclease